MKATTTLGEAIRRVENRRRQIEALIVAEMEAQLLLAPAPAGELVTTVHTPALPSEEAVTVAASPWRVVVWEG